MTVYRFPPGLGFGTPVLFTAEAMRIVAELTDEPGVYLFRQTLRSRGYLASKALGSQFTAGSWPGAPVPLAWNPASAADYPLEPAPRRGAAPQRMRRILAQPARGVVVGITDRREGTVNDRLLVPPLRTIRVLEVALAVPSGSARVVLVHPQDAQPVPSSKDQP